MAAIVLLAGITWMKKPEMFSFGKTNQSSQYATQDIPHYYAYTAPAATPLVAGASTDEGPSVINEDGTVSPIDMGDVLGASTQGVELSLDDIKVNTVTDSPENIKRYILNFQLVKNGFIDNASFETALSSNNQQQINQQAEKFKTTRNEMQKFLVPVSFVKLHKLTVLQFGAAIGVLENFTKADENPELVGQYLQKFLKSQQDLDDETSLVSKKYNLDPTELGAVGETQNIQQNSAGDF